VWRHRPLLGGHFLGCSFSFRCSRWRRCWWPPIVGPLWRNVLCHKLFLFDIFFLLESCNPLHGSSKRLWLGDMLIRAILKSESCYQGFQLKPWHSRGAMYIVVCDRRQCNESLRCVVVVGYVLSRVVSSVCVWGKTIIDIYNIKSVLLEPSRNMLSQSIHMIS
jgi:hypothetical protein